MALHLFTCSYKNKFPLPEKQRQDYAKIQNQFELN